MLDVCALLSRLAHNVAEGVSLRVNWRGSQSLSQRNPLSSDEHVQQELPRRELILQHASR